MKQILSLTMMALLFVSACGKNGSSGTNKSREDKVQGSTSGGESEPVNNQMSVSVSKKTSYDSKNLDAETFKEDINSYVIHFKIQPKLAKSRIVECKPLVFDQRVNRPQAEFNESGNAGIVFKLRDSDPNLLRVECVLMDKESNVLVVREVELKKSFIISSNTDVAMSGFSRLDRIGTLFLEKGSSLSSAGEDIHLEIDELVSEGGEITTFSEEEASQPYPDAIGKNGGDITLKVKEAFGQINIKMRGKNAGNLTTRPTAIYGSLMPDPNLNGKCKSPKRGGPNKENYDCFGKKGHTGVKGNKGKPGLYGGNTGKLELTVHSPDNLKINLEFIPGIGGQGEIGGLGGGGSAGGIGETVKWTTYSGCSREGPCNANDHEYKYPDGEVGDRGPDGDKGEKGEDGKVVEAQITLGKEIFNINNSWNN